LQVLKEGKGELIGWRDPDENRQWILENKPRELKDKQMSIQEAVAKFVRDGDFIASGGFGHVRVSMVAVYEMIRQGKKNLTMAGKTSVHDLDVLVTSGCVNRVEAGYSFGHELRGLSPGSRRKIEGGECQVPAENSNAGLQFRWLAAMLGVPFIPARNLMGTDTFEHSSAKIVVDPFSKKPVCLFPAAYPDVVFIHVSRCDVYGNSQIDGILVEDFELARAARRLVITTEEIVPPEEIRRVPWRTVIPYYLVDAVVEAPFGAHPCQMPGKYYFDEEHIAEYLDASKTEEGTRAYLEKYVFGVKDFYAYLELVGGVRKLNELARIEQLRQPPVYPWNEKKKGGK
jgi:3-oxoacid CoA-transferase subunit A/glutaconate CoA-transferase subunit A